MAKDNKKLVQSITSREEDFAQWYTDVVREAELCDYSSVKGCLNYLPNGYAIWENIQADLDKRFKETGVENVYLPMADSGESASERGGSRGRIRPGGCLGDTWRYGEITGETLYPPNVGDLVLRAVEPYSTVLQGSAKGMEPVELCFEMGENDPSVPALQGVFMAGRAYDSRHI